MLLDGMVTHWPRSLTKSHLDRGSAGLSDEDLTSLPSQLIEGWQGALGSTDSSKLIRRLNWDGYDAQSLPSLNELWEIKEKHLDERSEALLNELLVEIGNCSNILLEDPDFSDHQPFIDLWNPLRAWGISILAKSICRCENLFEISESSLADLASSLVTRLCTITEQVLWTEFSSGVTPGQQLLAHLGASGDGTTPPTRERYKRFIERQREDRLNAVFAKYPMLRYYIGRVAGLWLEASLELIQRVQADSGLISEKFGITTDSRLIHIQQDISDPHLGGRTVAVLQFVDRKIDPGSSAKIVKLVYKPKDLSLDAAYQSAIRVLNRLCELPTLRTLTIVCKDKYGYMEYVEHKTCSNEQELSSFYFNAGRIASILYVLGCTDCHYENLIASNDQLLLIDTETLLDADIPNHLALASQQPSRYNSSLLREIFNQSVLRSGLLPLWTFIGQKKVAVDISALGVSCPAEPVVKGRGWLGINTDGMMPGIITKPQELPTSLPVGFGVSNPFEAYLDVFCNGFKLQCENLFLNKDILLEKDGLFSTFAGLTRRIVLRGTRVYAVLRKQLLEPEALKSFSGQFMKLEQLARSFLIADTRPIHWPVFCAEVLQMMNLDIPFFTHKIGEDIINLGSGLDSLEGFFSVSGLEGSRERLQNLNHSAIDLQLQLIRGAVAARSYRADDEGQDRGIKSQSIAIGDEVSPQTALQQVANLLTGLAVHDSNGAVEWLGLDLAVDGETFSFGPVGHGLYSGSSGVALLLKYANRDLEVIHGILKPLRSLCEASLESEELLRWWRDQSLGLSGCGGVLLALLEIGEDELARNLIKGLPSKILSCDTQYDVVGGCSGLIGSLIGASDEYAFELAVAAGNHLIASQSDDGSWKKGSSGKGIIGFSHGTSGCITALSKLHAVTGDNRYYSSILRAIEYERANYSLEASNWPDYRTRSLKYMTNWCHGAPGVALSRVCLWGTSLWDEMCEVEINNAILAILNRNPFTADHLCCGSLGAAFLLDVFLGGPWKIENALRERGQLLADQLIRDSLCLFSRGSIGLRCFGTNDGGLYLPGFFNGLTGMAFVLMRSRETHSLVYRMMTAGLSQPSQLFTLMKA